MPEQEQAPQTEQEQRPPRKFAEIIAEMRAARDSYQNGTLTGGDYIKKIVELDRSLTFGLTDHFNRRSGVLVSLPEELLKQEVREDLGWGIRRRLPVTGIEKEMIERLERRTGVSEDFFKAENEIQSRQTVLNRFIENHPQLSAMTTADAVNIFEDTLAGKETDLEKYGNADPHVLMATAFTIFDLRREELKESHPYIYDMVTNTAKPISEVTAQNLMVSAPVDPEFEAWEKEKRQRALSEIRADKPLMSDIRALKPLLDCTDEKDFLEQHRARERITHAVAAVFARVYEAPGLGDENVATVYAPIEKVREDHKIGFAGGVAGIRGEEYVFIRNSLYAELLQEPQAATKRQVAEELLNTVFEEMRHGVDMQYADRLLEGELDESHPAFRHTNLIVLNHFNYTDDDEHYAQQYIERTAKSAATELSNGALEGVFPPQVAPQDQAVLELPTTTIRGNRP